jgi:acetyl esterase/lipase
MRTRAGRIACATAGLFALVILLPSLPYGLWMARLALAELSLILVGPLAIGGLLALGRVPNQRWFRVIGFAALAVSLVPVSMILPEYKTRGATFRPSEYFTWGPRVGVVEIRRDLILEPTLPEIRLDFYRGHGAGPRPLLVLVHGGSFSGGDKGENQTVSTLFAASGYSVADVQYRLAPAARFPVAVQDVKCLAGRLRARAEEFSIDATRVAYLGRSAGGAIAALAAYSAGDERIPPSCAVPDLPVAALISLYGPLELDWGWRQRPIPDAIVGYKALERYIGGTPTDQPEAYRLASAVSWARPSLPKTLLIHGTRDSLVSPHHTTLLIEAFERQGLAPPRRLLIPFADHGFDYHPGGLAEQLARAEILKFLAVVIPGRPEPGR